MTERIVIEIAGEEVGKGRARATRLGRLYTPAKTVRAEARLAYAGQAAMAGRTPLDGAVKLVVEIAVTIPTSWSKRRKAGALNGHIRPTSRPDIDNVLKMACDALNHVVFHDDWQIVEVAALKRYATAARMLISIEPISEPSP